MQQANFRARARVDAHMKRILALLALLSLALALPAVAPAKKKHKHSHHRATVLKGSFRAVGADGAYTDKKFGKAQLVDNRKRDKLSVHLRRLAPRTTYTFALYSVAEGPAPLSAGRLGRDPGDRVRAEVEAHQRAREPQRQAALEDLQGPPRRAATSCSSPTGGSPSRAPSSRARRRPSRAARRVPRQARQAGTPRSPAKPRRVRIRPSRDSREARQVARRTRREARLQASHRKLSRAG